MMLWTRPPIRGPPLKRFHHQFGLVMPFGGAVPKLAELVLPPAIRPSVAADAAGVRKPGAQHCKFKLPFDGHRVVTPLFAEFEQPSADAQLALPADAPAVRCAR